MDDVSHSNPCLNIIFKGAGPARKPQRAHRRSPAAHRLKCLYRPTFCLPYTSHQGTAPTSTSALREKIARFEKKSGVPVPCGSFGLGAPPPVDGHPRCQNELYGNRLP
ncbi:hypothetical protein P691DRAFT_822110, partial [Macrolepiota fuliginosa MF-IS2]